MPFSFLNVYGRLAHGMFQASQLRFYYCKEVL